MATAGRGIASGGLHVTDGRSWPLGTSPGSSGAELIPRVYVRLLGTSAGTPRRVLERSFAVGDDARMGFPLEPPDSAVAADGDVPYELVLRSQTGAEELLRELGALAELEEAILGHCEANRPEPLHKPQEYKQRLAVHGWIPETRVPPYPAEHDDLPINEPYDALEEAWPGSSASRGLYRRLNVRQRKER